MAEIGEAKPPQEGYIHNDMDLKYIAPHFRVERNRTEGSGILWDK